MGYTAAAVDRGHLRPIGYSNCRTYLVHPLRLQGRSVLGRDLSADQDRSLVSAQHSRNRGHGRQTARSRRLDRDVSSRERDQRPFIGSQAIWLLRQTAGVSVALDRNGDSTATQKIGRRTGVQTRRYLRRGIRGVYAVLLLHL